MTRLTKPISRARVTEYEESEWNVQLTPEGIYFWRYRSRRKILLPYPKAIFTAEVLDANAKLADRAKRRKRVKRGKLKRA